jgi:flagellar export protein FliJ
MSGSLSTLSRLHRQTIDRCKEEVALHVAEGARLEGLARDVRLEMDLETRRAEGDPLAASMLAGYIQMMRARAASLDRERKAVAVLEDRARDALAAAFLEEKKVELLIEAHSAREASADLQAQNAMLDEIAISRARRR